MEGRGESRANVGRSGLIDPAEHLGLAGYYVNKICPTAGYQGVWEDLYSAACLGIVEAAQTYDPARGSFAGHAYFRVRLRIIEEQRVLMWGRRDNTAGNKGKVINLPVEPLEVDGKLRCLPPTAPAQMDTLLEQERVALLYRALAKLPPFFRLLLIHSEGLCGQPAMSHKEMMKELGTTRKQFRLALGRARARLAELVERERANPVPAAPSPPPS